jgi:hypothetical protein
MDPGSSTGSGVDGSDMERGRLGRGLCIGIEAGVLGHSVALAAGERNMSSTMASRLDADLDRAAYWWADAGLRKVRLSGL